MSFLLAIDQGTTSSRAIVFDAALVPQAMAQREIGQIYPAPGHVEHDAQDIFASCVTTARQAIARAGLTAGDITAIGITNQRETTILWDRVTGVPIAPAIVWQDRRTAPTCAALRDAGHEAMVSHRTGLLLDPYFSATKIGWLLDHIDGARARAQAGQIAFGTVDTWLIWNLTGGRVHATDATNAARTMLYDIRKGAWDADLCALFGVPMAILPQVRDCADDFGTTDPAILGAALPIRGVAGDQQAATMGQACFAPGMVKATYGTGCFALLNTGATLVASQHRLLGTIAYRLDGQTTYALEGAIFVAGAVVQWLRDGLGLITSASQTEALAASADPAQEVLIVPAFTGLGAPHWDPDARGAIFGLTRNAGPAELARAALESVGHQTRDLIEAMRADGALNTAPGATTTTLRVDGGMAANDRVLQYLADILGAPVDRPRVIETTALGAAWLAGRASGLCPPEAGFAAQWALDHRFDPAMPEAHRAARYGRWQKAVQATRAVPPLVL